MELGTDLVAVSANGFDGLTSSARIHLFQDSMDVISYGKLREIQVRSDFLVCEAFGDESDQLLLAQSKVGLWSRILEGHVSGLLSHETEKSGT